VTSCAFSADAAAPPVMPSISGAARLYCEAMQRRMAQEDSPATEDRQDVRLAQDGDGVAYARLLRPHQETVARQMWRFTRDTSAHAELVEEVFVAAYMSLRGYRGTGPFEHWLRKIALRTGLAFWRASRKRQEVKPLDESLAARMAEEPTGYSASEAADLVHRALALLTPRDRLVLTLMHLEGQSVAEVADSTGWSVTMVKVQAWRARARLKKALESCGHQEAKDE